MDPRWEKSAIQVIVSLPIMGPSQLAKELGMEFDEGAHTEDAEHVQHFGCFACEN